jgi:ABC-type glycerol-3-phosphate transport system permease component
MKKNIKRFFRIKRTRKINRSLAGNMSLFIFMGICGLFMAAPLALIISNAFKPLDELFRYPPLLFPRNPSFDNFSDLAQHEKGNRNSRNYQCYDCCRPLSCRTAAYNLLQ